VPDDAEEVDKAIMGNRVMPFEPFIIAAFLVMIYMFSRGYGTAADGSHLLI
jgi:hypothetical protein